MRDKTFYLTINGVRWAVHSCGADADELEVEGDEVFGITKFATAEIFVRNEKMSEDIIYRTIKHELGHAYLYSYGMIAETMDEEDICNFLESHAEHLIRDAKYVFSKRFKTKRTHKAATAAA